MTPEALLVSFAHAVRRSGVRVSTGDTQLFLTAVAAVGLRRTPLYWAGRAALCRCPEDLARYDMVFALWFRPGYGSPRQPAAGERATVDPGAELSAGDPSGAEGNTLATVASERERLRHTDIATTDAVSRARLNRMFGSLRRPDPVRSTRRRRPDKLGHVHAQRTLRQQARSLGEPARIMRHRKSRRRRQIVMLIDVSGSMTPYAEALLRVAHHWLAGDLAVEAFTLGTRCTRVTQALRVRESETALRRAFRLVPDWSGGTRLGATIRSFLDRWGATTMVRGAVVVILSDGWERGDATVLAQSMRRLRLLATRVVWASPHAARPGYQPIQQGLLAALPFVDAFVAGHSLAAYDDLALTVGAGTARRSGFGIEKGFAPQQIS